MFIFVEEGIRQVLGSDMKQSREEGGEEEEGWLGCRLIGYTQKAKGKRPEFPRFFFMSRARDDKDRKEA